MKTDKFEAIVASIHDEVVETSVVDQAASRARKQLFGTVAEPEMLQTCADFQALMPAYLNRSLAPGKALLLTDHAHSCVECRQALDTSRTGNLRLLPRPKPVSSRVSPATRWAVAAALALGMGFLSWMVARSLWIAPGTRATVQTVDGKLFQVANFSSTPLFAGRELGDHQLVRTARDSSAMLRLADGSTVEMNGRSELFVTAAARGTTIHLDRGNIIVHAAKQHQGALYVKTVDCEVMVKGTIFAVTSATKGSRVSVVEGSVKVDQGSQSQMLKPGDEVTTSEAVAKVPIQDEISWSRDSAKYLAILGEFSGLQKQIEQIPSPGVRTSSKLLALVPANTALYAAMPNFGSTLTEANRLFQERVNASPILKEWWEEQSKSGNDISAMVQKIQTMSSYLGDEIVMAVPVNEDGSAGTAVFLAETKQPGIKQYLQNEPNLRGMSVYEGNGIVGLSQEPARIQELTANLQKSASEYFSDSGMYQRIQQAYQSGAEWLLCADLQRMSLHGPNARQEKRAIARHSGFEDVQYLVVERKEINGQTRNQAVISFAGNRVSLASWLAAPAPMSTLDFVSPDASLVASFVIQNPGALLTQFLTQAEADDPTFQQKIDTFQSETGVNITTDIANSLGGELTFAIDGPLVPVPSWKLAVEVYNPTNLEFSIEKLINAFNQMPNAPAQIQLTKSTVNGLTYYKLTGSTTQNGVIPAEVDYTYVDGYLLAAANQTLLTTSIQNRATGFTLPRSEKFRAQLPKDGNSNFSAIVYHNVAGLVGPLVDHLNSVSALSSEQKEAVAKLQSNSAPGLIYAYGEPNQITVAANGSLFGFSLDSLALPTVLHNMMHMQAKTQ
jgi:ferric-dicitrate binding protein FerR (iron transport regulator)